MVSVEGRRGLGIYKAPLTQGLDHNRYYLVVKTELTAHFESTASANSATGPVWNAIA